jgi:transketolase
MVGLALEAADKLAKKGVEARVLNMHTVKPLDEAAVLKAAKDCGAIVTVEEHSVIAGLGSAVAELTARKNPVPVEMVGIEDTFGESGEPPEILEKYGLTAAKVLDAARRALKRKG